MRFGAQANWGSDTDFGVGARVNYGLEKIIKNVPLTAMASFDWFFPGNNLTFWEINWDVAYNFRLPQPTIAPYAGAGLGFAYAKVGGGCTNIPGLDCSNTSVGLNLVGGARFKMRGKLTPYVEARADLHSGSQLVLTGGVLF
jgi:opacity protein-like surface antigen